MTNSTHLPNPVVRTTRLRAYPGWSIRQYADGSYDAVDHRCGHSSISPVEDTFQAALRFVRDLEPRATFGVAA